jgi:hypothetical protein
MHTQKSRFNRNLLVVLVILYLLSIALFSYFFLTQESDLAHWWMLLPNLLIISIPLVLIFGSIYVLVLAWREHSTVGQVSPRLAKIIHWAPRIAAILIIIFVTLFSFDVFGGDASLLEQLGGFIMHNIPSIVLIVLLIFSWKRPVVGFVAFLAAAVLFVIFFVRSIFALSNLVLFVLPLLLVAFLFYVDWKWLGPPEPPQTAAPTS